MRVKNGAEHYAISIQNQVSATELSAISMKPSGISWATYIRCGLGRRISLLGERFGSDFLIYNPLVMLRFHEESSGNAPKVAGVMFEVFPKAERILDVGSGSGAFAAELQRRGCSVVACERSFVGRLIASRQRVDCRPFDLRRSPPAPIEGVFDLVTCFEVGEHLPPKLGDRLVEFICAHAKEVAFTAAHPGQGGTGHINEQPKEYWIERFKRHGFCFDDAKTANLSLAFCESAAAAWFAANICVFTHCEPVLKNSSSK